MARPEVDIEVEADATAVSSERPLKMEQKGGTRSWWQVVLGIVLACGFLYIFLVGLQLLGDGFKCLGGKGAGNMFGAITNPIAGLMTGILATVLVQSSSTSTSIVVGLVGAEQISVKTAIPVIMGANIGTSVTNSLVSMGQSGDRIMLQRAFAGATVHDAFNMLTVAVLLPLEIIVGAIQGEGGPLYWLTLVFADAAMGKGSKGKNPLKGKSPTKIITSPVAKAVIKNNKAIIKALALGAPAAMTTSWVNETAGCAPLSRRLSMPAMQEEVGFEVGGSPLSRRLAGGEMDCSQFYCVVKDLDKTFKKISSSGYKKLTKCEGIIGESDIEQCGNSKCYMDAGDYFMERVKNGRIIKGGLVKGAGDVVGGIIALLIALALLCGGLLGLCKVLKFVFLGAARKMIVRATKMNDYVAMLVGIVITILVQSSSVTTSALTPLCGLGIIPLMKMLPMTLGANIGTTATALIAAIFAFTHDAIHIALCHLFFNIEGILIWYPVPMMRNVPLGMARLLGLYASYYRLVPAIYIVVMFVIVPGILLGVSALFDVSIAGGVVVLLLLLAAWGAFEVWWLRFGGCYRVLSKEAREEGEEKLDKANRELAGEIEETPEKAGETSV